MDAPSMLMVPSAHIGDDDKRWLYFFCWIYNLSEKNMLWDKDNNHKSVPEAHIVQFEDASDDVYFPDVPWASNKLFFKLASFSANKQFLCHEGN
jgi:hypothetical protein